jgi:putative transcriptional regulator
MLSENLKIIRKTMGLTQEEVASHLNVVRQTISKWEKGLSVPDAETLVKIADLYEVSISELLGVELENESNVNVVAEQLSRINEQLVIKNRRSRRIWKVVIGVVIAFVVLNIILLTLSWASFNSFENSSVVTIQSEVVVR